LSPRIPRATYRLQLGAQTGLREARALVGYLDRLGVSDLYSSPLMQARSGSPHGYDVTDPTRIDDALGSEGDFEALVAELHRCEMGLLLDVVPNHMAASHENPWWRDVLESGPSSPYSHFFDIQWRGPGREERESRLLLPVLGDHYGRVLHQGQLRLAFRGSGFTVRYFDQVFPIDPETSDTILEPCLEQLRAELPARHPALREVAQVLALVTQLPPRKDRPPRRTTERHRRKLAIGERLERVGREQPVVAAALEASCERLCGRKGDPDSFRGLHRLLERQAYRLSYWKTARLRINYRRFFDIDDLVGVRVDDPAVFEARHPLLRRLVQEGRVSGVRVDHVDGLLDPRGYLEALRQHLGGENGELYVLVEKILDRDEELRQDWSVQGTTGYDFLNAVLRLLVDPAGLERLEVEYRRQCESEDDMARVARRCRMQAMESLLAAELEFLGREIELLAARDIVARDISHRELRLALLEVGAALPVYRTYVREDDVSDHDRRLIRGALRAARQRTPRRLVSDEAFEFLEHVLLFEPSDDAPEERDRWLRTVGRWQQLTGPVMAKGYEDTACYVYNSFTALNEVGSDPRRDPQGFGLAPFHAFCLSRASRWPGTLNATSTHDTKRSEDVRARLAALADLAAEWEQSVKRWSHMNRPSRVEVAGRAVPDAEEESLIYQTLVGAWPLDEAELPAFQQRLAVYLRKALREAKRRTSWIAPHAAHEDAVLGFVETLFSSSQGNRFLRDFHRFQRKLAFYGALNSLSQTLLKLAAPGVPDLYQGTELWDLSLADPDNRRPVDFARRERLLDQVERLANHAPARFAGELLSNWSDGRIKLYLTWRALELRRQKPALFQRGDYTPLEAVGPRRDSVCAFARRHRKDWILAAVPRLVAQLVRPERFPLGKEVWGVGSVQLPDAAPSRWVDVLSGASLEAAPVEGAQALRLHQLFEHFPLALLRPAEEPP
jgi:(1->4)-alpha-D-glucan 1-alpha-D-glucosylmutase